MPIIPDKIDFRDETKWDEARKWGEEKEYEWKKALRYDEQITIEKLDSDSEKLSIYAYTRNMSFFSDVVSELESTEIKREELFDVQRIRDSISYKNLESDIMGFAKIVPSELGITSEIRDGYATISSETVLKIREQILNKSFKKFDFLEVDMTGQEIDTDIPILVEVRVPMGFNYGVLNSNNNLSLLLDRGFAIEPTSAVISPIKGRDHIFIEADLTQVLDFENKKGVVWGEENYSNFKDMLTSDQANAVSLYIKRDYQAINQYLRNGKTPNNDELNKKIDLLSSALSTKPIPEDITVYRRVGLDTFNLPLNYTFDNVNSESDKEKLDSFIREWTGKNIENLAYSSTSLSSADVSSFQPRKAIFRLHVPKGTNGAYITGFDEYASEKEVILDKSSTFKIYRITPIREIHPGNKVVTKVVIDAIVHQNKD